MMNATTMTWEAGSVTVSSGRAGSLDRTCYIEQRIMATGGVEGTCHNPTMHSAGGNGRRLPCRAMWCQQ